MLDANAQDSNQASQDQPKQEIPEDLQLKIKAIKSLVSVYDLLSRGHFDGFLAERLMAATAFIRSLNEQMVKEARQHEFAYLVKELQDLEKGV